MFPYCIKHQILKEFPLALSSKGPCKLKTTRCNQATLKNLTLMQAEVVKQAQAGHRQNSEDKRTGGALTWHCWVCSGLCLIQKTNIENKSKLRPDCWHCWWGHLEVPSSGWSGPAECLHLARTSDPSSSLWLERVTWTSSLRKG